MIYVINKTYRRKLMTIRVLAAVIVGPSRHSLAIQLAAAEDGEIVDMPETDPFVN